MLILHISDIHFRAPQCLNPDTDPDLGIRTRVRRHLLEKLAEFERPIDAMLVGGDLAFKADPAEYEVAKNWLLDLANASGCSRDRIFVVPGNHDVDRGSIKGNLPTRNVHDAVVSASNDRREGILREQLANARTGGDLFYGHTAYNDFAAPFNCQVYPSRIFWKQDIELAAGIQLRIHGLTSTMLSGRNGNDDPKQSLYLSPLQTSLDPVPDVVNLVMCHHPFDWLIDGDDVEDALNRRATLQCFGHKHRQRVTMEAQWVRWGAGAVNPSRNEGNYEPGYNLIQLGVIGRGQTRELTVRTHQYTYQANPERFDPIKTAQGADVFETTIPFPADIVPTFTAATPAASGVTPISDPIKPADAEAAMGEEGTRNIVARFWQLTGSQRRELALALGLISNEEIALSEPERYGKALIRAKQRNLIDELADRIGKLERQ